MKTFIKVVKILLIVGICFVMMVGLLDAAWVKLPEIQSAKQVEDVANYQKQVSEITIPEGVRIVGLGEATHGNVEFQELKLSVLQRLVETTDIRAFAMEADYGDGVLVNQYIHSEGDCQNPEEAVENLAFQIYQTSQMAELVNWMKQYNDTAAPEDQLTFYGFDVQNPEANQALVADFCEKVGLEMDLSDVNEVYNQLRDSSAIYGEDPDYASVLVSCKGVLHSQELENTTTNYVTVRDAAMADMVGEILALEEVKGHEGIMISGHNGHVSCQEMYYKSMGSHLREQYADAYFVIGTDYYKTTCNIYNDAIDGRGNYSFCSADPLAYQAQYFGGKYYLNFAEVQDGATGELINSTINNGSLGESYNGLMKFLPMSHRVTTKVQEKYNAMIFVYEANPTNPRTGEN